jgi:hypothetical protein
LTVLVIHEIIQWVCILTVPEDWKTIIEYVKGILCN